MMPGYCAKTLQCTVKSFLTILPSPFIFIIAPDFQNEEKYSLYILTYLYGRFLATYLPLLNFLENFNIF
jgi:hypothetical protein